MQDYQAQVPVPVQVDMMQKFLNVCKKYAKVSKTLRKYEDKNRSKYAGICKSMKQPAVVKIKHVYFFFTNLFQYSLKHC